MAFGDFKIGAASIMTNQPSEIRLIPAQAPVRRVAGGGYRMAVPEAGARLVVRWGVGAAKSGAYDELIADLGGTSGTLDSITLLHTLTWEDPAGNTFSLETIVDDVQVVYGLGMFYRPFTVTFREVPS